MWTQEMGAVYECRAKGIFRKEKLKPLVGEYAQIVVIDLKKKKPEMWSGSCPGKTS